MAKLSFNKLGLKINQEIKTVKFGDFTIEVKQYLPVNDKLKLMGEVLEYCMDQNNFANPVKKEVYTTICVIEYYTNINFTDKQKEEPTKIYDAICNGNLYTLIWQTIPETEREAISRGVEGIIVAYYQYTNSILGVLDNLKQSYDNKELDISNLIGQIKDPEAFEILKQIAPAMVGPTT